MRIRLPGTPGSPNRKIFRAAVVIGVLTLLVKLGGTAKELMVAGKFGRSDALDAFLIAYMLPSFLLALALGAFGSALIPVFVEARRKQSWEAVQSMFSSLMLLSTAAMAGLALLLGASTGFFLSYLASGFSPGKLQLTRNLLYGLLPFMVVGGIAGCMSAALSAMESFALPAITPLITPLATILLITLGPASWGAFLLVGGVVAGSLLETALLTRALRAHGLHLRFEWHGFTPEVRAVLQQFFQRLGGVILVSGTGVVDQSMAAMLPAGSVSALGYANKIVAALIGIAATALNTAAFPYLANMVAQNDWAGCRHTLKRYSLLVFAGGVPLSLALITLSRPLVRLLFERGAFTSADTELVSRVQAFYALQIPFYIAGGLLARFLSSVRRNDVLLYAAGASLVLDVVLNLLLMRVWGISGIALSTSLVYVCSFFALAACTLRLLGQHYVLSRDRLAEAAAMGKELRKKPL